MAEIVNILDTLATGILFSTYLNLAVIRYLSIFHGEFLNSFDDKHVVIAVHWMSLMGGLLIVLFEIWNVGPRSGYMYPLWTRTNM